MHWFSFYFQFIAFATLSCFALFCKNRPHDVWDSVLRAFLQLSYLCLIVPILSFCNASQEDIHYHIHSQRHVAGQLFLFVSFVFFQCIFTAYSVSDTTEFRKSSITPNGVLTMIGSLMCSYASGLFLYTRDIDVTSDAVVLAIGLGLIVWTIPCVVLDTILPHERFVYEESLWRKEFDKWLQSFIVHHWKDLKIALIAMCICLFNFSIQPMVPPLIWNVITFFEIVGSMIFCKYQYKKYHEVVVDETSAKSD